ncbi:MAG: hypothetical protein LBU15_02590 [Rickettsiales bacterium]|jgi:exonuclease VII small subunit|nr:hypothetical protein [Rickettsiales bacterium]
MDQMDFNEASSKLESILDELESDDAANFTPEEIDKKLREAEALRDHCRKLLKREKADIIKTARENDIPLEEIGLTEDDDDEEE